MIRKMVFLLSLFFVGSVAARAQGNAELFGGYSFERYSGSPARNLNGWEVTGQYKFAGVFGVVGDIDAHYGAPSKIDNRTLTFMVGPQASFPGRISPFVHALVGIGHIRTASATNTGLAAAIGGGIDIRLLPILSFRAIQVDDVITRFFSGTQNSARVSTGLVFRF